MNIVLICTEHSGENLLHNYLELLLRQFPSAQIYCQTSLDRFTREELHLRPNLHFLAERSLCSVMGFIEPFKRLFPLWRRTQFLEQQIVRLKPVLVIGFDGPDFCLRIEKKAKKCGAYTVHVVSPSVWAWRKGRIHTIAHSAHELHLLFAFEKTYYQKTPLITHHIGHPLLRPITPRLRSLPPKTLLLVPGSRTSEVQALLPLFLKWAYILKAQNKISQILVSRCADLDPALYPENAPGLIVSENFYRAIQQADFALSCSGTATLEIAAHGCPLMALYSLDSWKHFILSFFIQTPFIALPNIILKEALVPEFFGDLKALFPKILDTMERSLEPDKYKGIAKNFYAKIAPMILQEQSPCLSDILQTTFIRASMKPAVEL